MARLGGFQRKFIKLKKQGLHWKVLQRVHPARDNNFNLINFITDISCIYILMHILTRTPIFDSVNLPEE